MTEGDTIVDVAKKALGDLRRQASIRDIYVLILRDVCMSSTANPEHVLWTTIRGYTRSVEHVDARASMLFEIVGEEF